MFVDALATHAGAANWPKAFKAKADRYDADFSEMMAATQRRLWWISKEGGYFMLIPGLGKRAWRAYLASFPDTARKAHHCQCCKESLIRWGGVVGVTSGGNRHPLIVGSDTSLYSEFLRRYHQLVAEMSHAHLQDNPIPTLVLFPNNEVGIKQHVAVSTVARKIRASDGSVQHQEVSSVTLWEHFYFSALPDRQVFKSRSYGKVLTEQGKLNEQLLQFIESTKKLKAQQGLVSQAHIALVDSTIAELKKDSELVRFVPPLLLLQDAIQVCRTAGSSIVEECITLFFRYRDRIGNKAWFELLPVKALVECCNRRGGTVQYSQRHTAAREIASDIAAKSGDKYMRKCGEVKEGAVASLVTFMSDNKITMDTLTRRIARVGELCQYPCVAAWLAPEHPCNGAGYGANFRIGTTAPAHTVASEVAKAMRRSARVARATQSAWSSAGWRSEDLCGWGEPMDMRRATRPMLNTPEASTGWLSQGMAIGITMTQLVELLGSECYRPTSDRATRVYLSPGDSDSLMATTMPLDAAHPDRAAVLKWDVEALKMGIQKGMPMSMYVTDERWRVPRRVDGKRNRVFHAVDAILRTGASALEAASAVVSLAPRDAASSAPSHCGYTMHLHPAVTTELISVELITGSGMFEEILHPDYFQHAGAIAALSETLPMRTPSNTQGYARYNCSAENDSGVTAYWQQAANQWAIGVDYRAHQSSRLQSAATAVPPAQRQPIDAHGVPFAQRDTFFTRYSPLVLLETNVPARGVSNYSLFCLTGI